MQSDFDSAIYIENKSLSTFKEAFGNHIHEMGAYYLRGVAEVPGPKCAGTANCATRAGPSASAYGDCSRVRELFFEQDLAAVLEHYSNVLHESGPGWSQNSSCFAAMELDRSWNADRFRTRLQVSGALSKASEHLFVYS